MSMVLVMNNMMGTGGKDSKKLKQKKNRNHSSNAPALKPGGKTNVSKV